ncbi:phosphoesterase [Paenibacillus glucanolyticus]|uniref:Phosphoesterase n=1 Tax=Paenibacillus glucanolyticus TaxID=59843 RepID=A0A163H3N1_9BACL|nr:MULTISPECIES: metallophosphoesterase [Paenibacillus]AWP25864.1 phosphoesterase [Paenibacillus sp. Cedars]KZS45299.1 phosphoesterase [Paenibacillus glucanolyticus]MPY18710.1 metallophosphoesterase [Paenibacillus glucanolyticus]
MRNPSSEPLHGTARQGAERVSQRKTLSRRQFLKAGLSTVVGAGAAAGAYAYLWEPHRLEVTRLEVRLPSLPKAFDGMKVAHFSDLHLGFHTGAKDVERVVQAIHAEKPDMICFTGDMVDGHAEDMTEAIKPFATLKAPLGLFSILGNHDYGDVEKLTHMEEEAGFRVLRNSSVKLRRDGAVIAVVGLDDGIWGNPDPIAATRDLPEGMFKLLLMHEPDYGDIAAGYSFHVQLSGHSHGGQVRLPLVGEVITPPGAKLYVQGLYHIGSQGMQLYVNRGIGTTGLPFRFLCKPELTMLTLRSMT